jgi:hypothetical protein
MPVLQTRPLIQAVLIIDLYVPEPPLLIMSTASFLPFTSGLRAGATVRYVIRLKRSFNLPPLRLLALLLLFRPFAPPPSSSACS